MQCLKVWRFIVISVWRPVTWSFRNIFWRNLVVLFGIHRQSCNPNFIAFQLNYTHFAAQRTWVQFCKRRCRSRFQFRRKVLPCCWCIWESNAINSYPCLSNNKCISKTQTVHTGVHSPRGGLPPCDLHFLKALVELMLSSNWQVTLRLTVFEIFAVKYRKFRPKISDLGITWGTSPKREKDQSGIDMYHHSGRSVSPSPRYL